MGEVCALLNALLVLHAMVHSLFTCVVTNDKICRVFEWPETAFALLLVTVSHSSWVSRRHEAGSSRQEEQHGDDMCGDSH